MTPYDFTIFAALVAITGFTVWNIHNRQIVDAYGTTVSDLKPLPMPKASPTPVPYATKEELKQVTDDLAQAWISINKNSLNRATDEIAQEKEITILKDEVKTLHSRMNDIVKNRKAEPKQVHVTHSYTTPMQVDLSYPDKVQTKKGKLLERAGVR